MNDKHIKPPENIAELRRVLMEIARTSATVGAYSVDRNRVEKALKDMGPDATFDSVGIHEQEVLELLDRAGDHYGVRVRILQRRQPHTLSQLLTEIVTKLETQRGTVPAQ